MMNLQTTDYQLVKWYIVKNNYCAAFPVFLSLHHNKTGVEVVNRKGGTDASEDRTIVKPSPLLIKAAQPLKGEAEGSRSKRVKAAVEDYWRKNEAVFVPK